MAKNAAIETGVDRLLAIIRKNKKISLDEAAKILGVSPAVTEEWGDFLEDEKFIKKEFKLTKTYFVIADDNTTEVIKKAEDFHRKKEGFIRKAEVSIAELDKDGQVIRSLRDEFEKLQKDMSKELKGMQVELKELEKYELMKGNLDKEVEEQKLALQEKINKINEDVKKEQAKYEKLLGDIDIEKVKLEKEKEEELSIRETELSLKTKLADILSGIDKIKNSLKINEDNIARSDEHIKGLTKLSQKIKSDVESKKKLIDGLLDENKKIEKEIVRSQNELMNRISQNQQLMKKATKGSAEDRFKEFFTKKRDFMKLIEDVSSQKELLEKDLMELIKKAKSFKLSHKGREVSKKLEELEKMHSDVESKRKDYESNMLKLGKMMGLDSSKSKKKFWFFNR